MEGKASVSSEVGDILELEIEKLVFRGAGLARWMGKVVFVEDSAPQDLILARVTQVKNQYLLAETQEVLSPSAQRTPPFCPHFRACGGCQWQHVSLTAQREWKEKILAELLASPERAARLPIMAPHPVCPPGGYRTRAQIKVAREGNRARLGFFRLHSQELVEIDDCPLLHPDLRGIYRALRDLLYPTLAQLYPALREIWMHRGSLKGETLLTLITPRGSRAALRLLYHRVQEICPGISGIALSRGRDNAIYDLVGKPWVEMTLEGLALKVGPVCFYQVGEEGAQSIFRCIKSWISTNDGQRILDLYCGVGTFALPLACQKGVGMVVGVEGEREAAILAKENARRNGMSNVKILHGTAEDLIGALAKEKYDVTILDPPRSGITRKAMDGLLRLGSPRIVYVSCDPSTLARDLDRLRKGGYRCIQIQPLDLFPHTYHVEVVALLEADHIGGRAQEDQTGGGNGDSIPFPEGISPDGRPEELLC